MFYEFCLALVTVSDGKDFIFNAVDTIGNYSKVSVSIQTYLVTSNEELLKIGHIRNCEKRLPMNKRILSREVTFHLNNKLFHLISLCI